MLRAPSAGEQMRALIGLAFLVLAIFLTPAAWDVIFNSGGHPQGFGSQAIRHILPAAAAWVVGIWILSGLKAKM